MGSDTAASDLSSRGRIEEKPIQAKADPSLPKLAFSSELPITPPSARSWPGAERTAAWPNAGRQDLMGPASRVSAFRAFEPFRLARRAVRQDGNNGTERHSDAAL